MAFENAEIYGYLSEYAAALESFDAERAAALWGTPSTVLTDEAVSVAHNQEDLGRELQKNYPQYQKLGLASVGNELIEVNPLTERLVRVRVRWVLHDRSGAILTAISYIYVLRRDDDGVLRAYVAVPIEEDEKLARLAKRRGVALDD